MRISLRGLAIDALHFAAYVVLGVVFSGLIALWYVNSPAYCRDCDTGLGLCMCGFVLSVPITLLAIYFTHRHPKDDPIADPEEIARS
ncbi:MAG: hypothetical protein KC547_09110 [Anaerolineae bacterium]|nr:hypothetical protein [Anaerolineae bacterium]MCA9907134.1 hypothetical protein [Anaerolineae bacterium]